MGHLQKQGSFAIPACLGRLASFLLGAILRIAQEGAQLSMPRVWHTCVAHEGRCTEGDYIWKTPLYFLPVLHIKHFCEQGEWPWRLACRLQPSQTRSSSHTFFFKDREKVQSAFYCISSSPGSPLLSAFPVGQNHHPGTAQRISEGYL